MASNKNKQESAMPGLYYEQFSVGQKFEHSVSRTVTEMDNMLFSCLTMNTQPLHIDAEFASHTEFGKPLVNSLFTLGLLIGMTVTETTLGTTIANLGLGDTQFPHPVFQGDTLRAHTEVLSVRASRSRPSAGLVEFEHTAVNR
ncbi:MaoC family dehydratase [Pseudomonas sp.]|uniref:MaoC family dehydratase n=1 Tax=Pseudomonas sp. TaxID=306 RepID=UPI00345AA08D